MSNKQPFLPGGRYAAVSAWKKHSVIVPAIRSFRIEYLLEHGYIVDQDRPT